jgi:hypothetical protein
MKTGTFAPEQLAQRGIAIGFAIAKKINGFFVWHGLRSSSQ